MCKTNVVNAQSVHDRFDGNAVIGHRLYKEVSKFESKPEVKGKENTPTIITEWETLATNLEEFHKVVVR